VHLERFIVDLENGHEKPFLFKEILLSQQLFLTQQWKWTITMIYRSTQLREKRLSRLKNASFLQGS
jgi:hypothetical protein